MKLVELYKDGNVRDDIDPEDCTPPKMRKSTATYKYDCSIYTEELNKIIESRKRCCEKTTAVTDSDMSWKNAPWN